MNTTGSGGINISGSESIYAHTHGIALKELRQWGSFFRSLLGRGDAAAAGIYIGSSESQVREMLTQGNNLVNYEPGEEFNYNGTIYTMDEEGHIK